MLNEISPRRIARITGLLLLLTILTGIFAQGFVSDRLVVSGDAAATATNILAHKGLFQLGFTVFIIEMVCQVAKVALFYVLLKPVNRSVALVSAFIELTGSVIKTFARVFFIAPLFILGGSPALSGFSGEQLQSLGMVLLKVNGQGAGMGLAFFGFSTVLQGYLILRSTFLPRWLGWLSIVSGVGWLTFLYQPLGSRAFFPVVLVALLGSAAMIFWLLVFGVNEEKWKELARA